MLSFGAHCVGRQFIDEQAHVHCSQHFADCRRRRGCTARAGTYCRHPDVQGTPQYGAIVERLRTVLAGRDWEVIFADDDFPDGTAAAARAIGEHDHRVRCIRRIGRRGLAGACIEGMLTSQARYVAVMDADLQHDETLLVKMLDRLRKDDVDLVVATRYLNGKATSGFSAGRSLISRWSNVVAQKMLGVTLSDPMSGFFMMRRQAFEDVAPKLSTQGFKILLDIAMSTRGNASRCRTAVRVSQPPARRKQARRKGRARLRGADHRKAQPRRPLLPLCAVLPGGPDRNCNPYVGPPAGGEAFGLGFVVAQTVATSAAITWNYILNNAITYRDRRLTGWRFWAGLLGFQLICGIGAVSNIGVASLFYGADGRWWLAGDPRRIDRHRVELHGQRRLHMAPVESYYRKAARFARSCPANPM